MSIIQSSHTGIVNAALAELGSTEKITSFDDATSGVGRRARALWSDILRELLYQHPWNFAIRRATLNPHGDVPAYGVARQFQLPVDCLRWLPEGDATARRVEREGDKLLTDADTLAIRYIAFLDDPSVWSPLFVRAMTLALAAAMAEGVTQSEGIKDRLAERAEMTLRKAKRADGLESGDRRRGQVQARSDWLTARQYGYTYSQR